MSTFVSLFSGCGGFDKGFVDQGHRCLGAYDIDPAAVAVYKANIGNHAKICDLSTGVLPDVFQEPVDIVLSGSPCQGFSTVGKRRLEDPRNKLLMMGGQIAVSLGCKIFIAENVMGSVSGELKQFWDKLETYMTSKGYLVKFFKCDITNVGLPQSRKRVIMVASRIGREINFVTPAMPMLSLRSIFTNLEGLPNHDTAPLAVGSIDYLIASRIGPGQKLSNVRGGERAVHTWNIPQVFGAVNQLEERVLLEIMALRRKLRKRDFGDADPVELGVLKTKFTEDISEPINQLKRLGYLKDTGQQTVDLVQTFNGKYRRLCYTKVSPTVDTRFGNFKYFLHPEEHRAISVREAARIQGFPDEFIFSGNRNEQYRMIGNAVPPIFSRWIAAELDRNLAD